MELCDKYMHEYILYNPTINDLIKSEKYNHLRGKMENIYSDTYSKMDEKLDNKYLKLLKKKKDKTHYDKLFYEDLKINDKLTYFESQYFPLSSLDNIYLEMIHTIKSKDSDYKFIDVTSYKDFIERLKKLKEITNCILSDLKEGIKNKYIISDIILHRIIEQLEECIKTNTVENNFNHPLKIPLSIKSEFINTIDDYLIKNIKKILEFLINEYASHCKNNVGLSSYKNGKRYYRDLVKITVGKDYTPEEVHKIGLKEVSKCVNKINSLKRKMDKKLSYSEFIKEMNEKKPKKTNFIAELKKHKKRINSKIFPKYFDDDLSKIDDYEIKSVTKEEKNTSAYYLMPDLKNERKGIFYINTLDPSRVNMYELQTLSLHEAIPGHHYEISKNKTDKPLYFKLNNYTAYSEGWALYCESFIEPENVYEIFWNLIYSLHRCIRLVVDTGIHYYSWSYEKSFQYMNKYLPFTDEHIKNEICRYIDDPAQAISYKIGELTILELKDLYFKKYKNDYKGFHSLFLKIGPCPLDILKKKFISYL